ncbi:MAG: hypothetical protein OEY33_09845 [Bdellovibrionales bacterium]|nr:hypothetical protein [Bdellovibrionales bacterium]
MIINALIISNSSANMEVLVVKKEDLWSFPERQVLDSEDAKSQCLALIKDEYDLNFAADQVYELSCRSGNRRSFLLYMEHKKEVKKGEFKPLLMVKELHRPYGAILCEALGVFWPLMPSFINNLRRVELPSLFVKKDIHKSQDEVVFYGGSFNPWHPGHLSCLESCPAENIIVVPDYNPWKNNQGQENRCFWNEYRKLCLELKDTPYAIYPGFWGLEDPNPTINWIPNIKTRDKGLLLGDDSFCSIKSWKDSEILISLLKMIYVVPRIHKKEEVIKVREEVLKIHPSMEVHILPEHEYMHESSTLLREQKLKILE